MTTTDKQLLKRCIDYLSSPNAETQETEDKLLEDLRAALAAPATAPSWQDAPTCAGVWVRNSGDCIGAYLIHESAIPILQGSRSRWFGPLPEDKS